MLFIVKRVTANDAELVIHVTELITGTVDISLTVCITGSTIISSSH